MKGKYVDASVISEEQFFQSVIQDRELIFRRHGITHIRYASLFFTPCDAQGRAVTVYDDGRPIELYDSTGCYRSAADQYDTGRLEPATYARQN